MTASNQYDVTQWRGADAHEDIGRVLNEIIADVKARQTQKDVADGGKPGAVITIPPGDYRLRTQVLIDISFLRVQGAGHGFTSSSIRFNVPPEEQGDLHELWPGGSRILVDLPSAPADRPEDGAAIRIAREGSPRLSSVELSGFCLDGLHFTGDAEGIDPENTYANGRTGVLVETANDSFRVSGMGFVYLEHALVVRRADALSIHDSFIAECGSCIELTEWGQASKVTDNLIGAGPAGHSIYAENHGGLLISANNVFPRGASSVHLSGVTRSTVTGNRLHSFYPGMLRLIDGSSENLVAANHLLHDHEPWTPFLDIDNGLDDEYGTIRIAGDGNSVLANHISEAVDADRVRPVGTAPVIIRVVEGTGNHIATNHVVGTDATSEASDSCFEAQVGALLGAGGAGSLPVRAVVVDEAAAGTTVLDSGTEEQVVLDPAVNAFRPTPSIGAAR